MQCSTTTSCDVSLSRSIWHRACYDPAMRERLEAAALFIGKLYELSRRSPHTCRRAVSVGRDIGLAGADLGDRHGSTLGDKKLT